ncbi:MAG TPA: transporter, partial [Hyphomicrobiaceae bacterium]|nr:transporter [Hyphomicrobiaceae bacterium]
HPGDHAIESDLPALSALHRCGSLNHPALCPSSLYFNQKTGNEFSAVLGFTYNFQNFDTDHQNGIDMHLDWAASKFLTKQWQVGLVGYAYQQLTEDSGARNRVGASASRTARRLPVKFALRSPRVTWRAKATSPPASTDVW